MAMIRVEILFHLQNLARSGPEVLLEDSSPVTINTVLDALEQRYPMLCGTIRDHVTKKTASLPALFWLPAGSVFCGDRRTASGVYRPRDRTRHYLGRAERRVGNK